MWGGPSQLETYDCKPDAPSEYRGPLRPIHTTVPGIDICEVFPLQAKLGHRISLVRSLHHSMSSHNDGSIELLTGKTPAKEDPTSTAKSDHPDFGMIASQLRGTRAERPAAYVGIPRVPFMMQPTYLGMTHSGFAAGNPSRARISSRRTCRSTPASTARGWTTAAALVAQFDRYRRGLDLHGAVDATDQFREQAFQLLTSTAVAEAFAMDKETPAHARSLRPAPVGTELPAGAAAGRGRRQRDHDRRALARFRPTRSTSVGTTTPTRPPAGTWKAPCAGGRRSWTRGCRR